MKSKRIPQKAITVVAAVLIILAATVINNHFHSDYSRLSETDQAILAEYNSFCSQESATPLWLDYDLSDKTIALLSKDSMSVYLVNPTHEIQNVFSTKIALPDSFTTGSVYRISILIPEILIMKATGNFNTIGKTYPLFGDDVYYIKYEQAVSLEQQYVSGHFITLLSHEAFHYYMQEQWKIEEHADIGLLSNEDLQLMRKEYDILEQVHQYFLNRTVDINMLRNYAKQYVAIMDARIAANPAYTTSEISKETAEGSATYVGIKASDMVGYDYGVMYFDNIKDVPFSDVFQQLDAGNIEKDYLYNRMPYETGALLCQMLDSLNVPDWQKELNEQTLKTPKTLYSGLKSYMENIN